MGDKREYYFGACDLQMEAFVDRDSFRRSLVLNVLFHGDLVVPDVFFFISNHVHDIVASNEPIRSFLAECVRNSAIIPAFRNAERNNFRDGLAEIQKDQIQGIHPGADAVRDFLEGAARGRRRHYRVWPKEPVSVGYSKTLERIFGIDPPSSSPAFERVWARTNRFRRAIFEDIAPDDSGGVRRGAIFNAINSLVHKNPAPVGDARSIWRGLGDEDLASDVKKFLKWCNYAYQYNQGRMFGLGPSLTSMDGVDVEFSRHLMMIGADDHDGKVWNELFVIPGELALLTVDPKHLFDVRDGQTGVRYFDAVESWQRRPSEESSNVLLDALSAYTRELSRLYIARGKSVLNWEWRLNACVPQGEIWNKTAMALARDFIGEMIPHFGLLSLVGPFGAATYEWWPASVSTRLGISNRLGFEIDARAQRMVVPSARVTDAAFQ
jgi:hypothetical protein